MSYVYADRGSKMYIVILNPVGWILVMSKYKNMPINHIKNGKAWQTTQYISTVAKKSECLSE